MLPLIASNLLDSIGLLSNAMRLLADKAIAGLKVRRAAGRRGAGPQSDSGHRAQPGHRLRSRGDRQARLRGKPAGPRRRDRGQRACPATLRRLLDPAELTKGGIKVGTSVEA